MMLSFIQLKFLFAENLFSAGFIRILNDELTSYKNFMQAFSLRYNCKSVEIF